jgi:hypothetical protein
MLLVLGLALAACGDDDGTPGADAGADAAVTPDAATGDAGTGDDASITPLAGELQLVEVVDPWSPSSRLHGVLAPGGFPVWQEETARQGDCRLLAFIPHFCEEWCDGVCVAENVCEPWPTYASAGALTVTGAKASLAITPGDYGFMGANVYYWYGDTADLFDDGDPITATFAGAGAAVPGFAVTSAGVAPLALTSLSNDELALPNGQDVVVTWEAGAADTRVRLTLNANSAGGHGSPYEAIIECDTADDGSVTIPRALVEAFPETYRWEMCAGKDCPMSTAVRYRRGSTDIAGGRVELRVGASVSFWILHDLP